MYILGITHPISSTNAAVIVNDGEVISAVEEERFVRIKQAPKMFPFHSIDWCIKNAGINDKDIDIIGIGWDGYHDKEEIKNKFTEFQQDEKNLFIECFELEKNFLKYLKNRFPSAKIIFVRHHLAHAASSCFVSGFDKSLFLTLDARGEYESGLVGIYDKGDFEIIRRLSRYESVGHFYSQMTNLIGFKGHFDEGKTMGLAPYGKPIESLLDLIQTHDTGRIEIDGSKLASIKNQFKFLGSDPTKDERKNIAATAQFLLEKTATHLVKNIQEVSSENKICLAGGTALNIDMNSRILEMDNIKDIFIQPASGDAGTALGAALYLHHQFSSKKITPMKHVFLGPQIDEDEVIDYLKKSCIAYETLSNIPQEIAEIINQDRIVAWVQGKAEFGPRALGSRSLLGNARKKEMWLKMNKVKHREYWRPLAPSIIEEKASEFFESKTKSPFMLLGSKVKDKKIESIPAVVHVDKTARHQTVNKNDNRLYWELLNEVGKNDDMPIIINTSLNLKGDTIVNSLQDALRTFYSSEIDNLCIGKVLISKS